MPATARTGLAPPGSSRRLLVAALGALAVLVGVDLAVGSVLIVPLLVLPPLVLALAGRPWETAVVAGAAVVLVIVSGAANGTLDTGRWRVALLVVAGGGVAAWVAARVRRRLEVDAARLELLVALSGVGTGATVERTAARLGDLVVPAVADVCVIERAAEDGRRRILCARVAAPAPAGVEERLREVSLFGGRADAPTEHEPALLEPVTDEMLRAAAPDDAGLEVLRSLRLRSVVSAPLEARGRPVGLLHMAVGPSGRRYGPRDLRFAEVLAGRMALALENAGLSAELLDAERRFEAIVDGMLDGVTVRAADGRLVYANDAAVELLRVESHEALQAMASGDAMALFDVFDADGRPVTLDQLPGARAWHLDHDPEPLIVRNVVHATGEQRWLLSKATTIRDADGRPLYVANFTEDVTAVKRAELAQRVLAEAGRVLVSSLDEQQTLEQLAMLAVPELADWCGVDMPGRGGTIQPVAVGHVDPAKVAVARELRERYPVSMAEPQGLAAVLRGDVPHFLVDETPDEALAEYAVDDDHLALMRRVGFNSIMIVPVVGRSAVLAALTFVSAQARRFDAADLELALELGRRAGVALENARLYSERTDIAHTLQVALVPDPVPLAPGWDVAALYRPAGEATEAGGDFYDMVRTRDGWLVVMGDVAGKGARAASLTALARYTLRTAAMLTGDPGAALAALNAGLMRRDDVAYCTAALVALSDDGGDRARARVYSAGHPLPVLLREGTAQPLGRSGPLLGALEDANWPASDVVLGPGDRLLLYTDGVTDARGPRDRFGDERLLELLSSVDGAAPTALVQAIDGAIRGFEHGAQRDDTALLAVARLRTGELAVPGGPSAVGLARAAVAAGAEGALPADRLGDLALMTSELVTNAVRHGGAAGPDDRVRVCISTGGPRVRVEVRDDGPGFDVSALPVLAAPPGEGGMGLGLVAGLADAWGAEREGGTTVVWFEVDPARPGSPIH